MKHLILLIGTLVITSGIYFLVGSYNKKKDAQIMESLNRADSISKIKSGNVDTITCVYGH